MGRVNFTRRNNWILFFFFMFWNLHVHHGNTRDQECLWSFWGFCDNFKSLQPQCQLYFAQGCVYILKDVSIYEGIPLKQAPFCAMFCNWRPKMKEWRFSVFSLTNTNVHYPNFFLPLEMKMNLVDSSSQVISSTIRQPRRRYSLEAGN